MSAWEFYLPEEGETVDDARPIPRCATDWAPEAAEMLHERWDADDGGTAPDDLVVAVRMIPDGEWQEFR